MDALFNCFVASVDDAEHMVKGRRDLLTIYISRNLIERFCYNITVGGIKIIPSNFMGIQLKVLNNIDNFYCVGFGHYE